MKPLAYYNENDPRAAAWLRELITRGLIAAGEVDERSICDVRPHEIQHFTQQHFFAGVGGWSLALRLAGWPDSRPVRTGSCPCQPFSQAGKGLSEKDARHLWPVFRDLITFGEPTVTFGEQVASKAGRLWLAGVRADLEGLGYAVGAADLCAAGVGAPHIRQRLYWVADRAGDRRQQGRREIEKRAGFGHDGAALGLADADGGNAGPEREQRGREHGQQPQDGGACGLGDSDRAGSQPWRQAAEAARHWRSAVADGDTRGLGDAVREGRARKSLGQLGAGHQGFWSAADWIPCTDGKARRVEPGSFPLAHGVPARVVRLRGYGNAIVPQVAAEFVAAFCEVGNSVCPPLAAALVAANVPEMVADGRRRTPRPRIKVPRPLAASEQLAKQLEMEVGA